MSRKPSEPSPTVVEAAKDGRARRWSGQHERRRAEFVEAALLAIAEHGPDASTEQIAQRAGVARTRLYKHFAGAAELNQAIAARAVDLVTAELEPVWNPQGTPTDMIGTAVATHLRWLTEHSNLYRYLTKHSVSGHAEGSDVVADIKGSIAQHLAELFAGYLTLFEVDTGLAEPLAWGLVGYVDSAATRWVENPGATTFEQMSDFLARGIWAILDDALRSYGLTLDPHVPLTL
ncbi:TetR/AcrR family transcriptional regulator [Nocardioides pacificus]